MRNRHFLPARLLLALALATPAAFLAGPVHASNSATMAPAGKSAMQTFQTRQDAVMKLLRKQKKGKLNSALKAEVDQLLDYEWLATAALGGKKGLSKCEPKCDEFKALLEELVRENYLKRIRLANRGDLTYAGENVRPKASKVNTVVTYDRDGRKQKLKIDYVMHQVDGRWVVRDILTDGVSLARNYKFEFKQVLDNEGIDGLISRLQQRLKEVRASAAEDLGKKKGR